MAETIRIDRELCLNDNYKKVHCQKCRDYCPVNCIDEALQIQSNLCNQCGLCIAACPTEAVAGIHYSNREWEQLAVEKPPLLLACRKQNSESSWPCLGFLESRALVALAYGKQLIIDDRLCRTCKAGVQAHLDNAITQANGVLSFYGNTLIQSGEGAAQVKRNDKTVSRRAFFSAMFGAAVSTVREVTFPTDGRAERLERQKLISATLSSPPSALLPEGTQAFSGIAVSDACQACGMCAKFCTAKAITITDRTDELEIYHEPVKCSNCELCVVHCPAQAIQLSGARQLGRYKVITAKLPRCSSCGHLYQPINNQPVCLECMLKNRTQMI